LSSPATSSDRSYKTPKRLSSRSRGRKLVEAWSQCSLLQDVLCRWSMTKMDGSIQWSSGAVWLSVYACLDGKVNKLWSVST